MTSVAPPGARTPAVAPPPTHGDATRAEHVRALARSRGAVFAVVVGAAGALIAGGAARSAWVALAGALAVVAGVAGVVLWLADRRAAEDFFEAFAESIGFRYAGDARIPPLTPLLAAGQRRHCRHLMVGSLTADDPALGCALGHYTFEVRHESGSENQTEKWEPHHFTVAAADVDPTAVLSPGVFVRPRRDLLERLDGDRDWLRGMGLEAVALESSVLEERCEVLTADGDAVRVRRFLAPSLVAWLAAAPRPIGIEYRGGGVAAYVEGHVEDAGVLELLLETVRMVAKRARAVTPGAAA